jgi:hypothetical protein
VSIGTIAACFHKLRKVLRQAKIKSKLDTLHKVSEQPFITKPGIPSSPTDFAGGSHFVVLRTSEFQIGTKKF